MPNEDRAWIGLVGIPELLELDTHSAEILAKITLAPQFEKPLPHIALSPDGAHLAVLGSSPIENNYFHNASVVILNTQLRTVQSVVRLKGVPGNPTFTSDGRLLCILNLSMHHDIWVVEIKSGKSSTIPFEVDTLGQQQIGIFDMVVHPARDDLVASLADARPESHGPLNKLVVYNLQEKKVMSLVTIAVRPSHLYYQSDGIVLYTITPDGIAALDGNTFAVLYEIKSRLLDNPQGDRRNPRYYMPGKLLVQELK